MKIVSTLILLVIFVFTASAQDTETAVYQIKNVYQNADLNEKAIERFKKNIDFRSETDEILKLFQPIKGKYKVISFMNTGYGLMANHAKDIYHNILILKVNEKNEVLDGLEYCLEWAEPPFTVRLLRVTKKGVKLQKGLQISQLEFQPFERYDWKLNGIVDNLYDFKEIF